jgi:hypothetical protein
MTGFFDLPDDALMVICSYLCDMCECSAILKFRDFDGRQCNEVCCFDVCGMPLAGRIAVPRPFKPGTPMQYHHRCILANLSTVDPVDVRVDWNAVPPAYVSKHRQTDAARGSVHRMRLPKEVFCDAHTAHASVECVAVADGHGTYVVAGVWSPGTSAQAPLVAAARRVCKMLARVRITVEGNARLFYDSPGITTFCLRDHPTKAEV